MNRLVRSPRSTGYIVLLTIGIALAAAFLITTNSTASKPKRASAPPPAPAAVPHFVDLTTPGTPRIVVIADVNQPLPGTSNPAGVLMTNLREGHIPAGATTATVMSDANCDPDVNGISHCLNDLNIGGIVVTVQHHHAMTEVPCLSPGETVRLMTFAAYQHNL